MISRPPRRADPFARCKTAVPARTPPPPTINHRAPVHRRLTAIGHPPPCGLKGLRRYPPRAGNANRPPDFLAWTIQHLNKLDPARRPRSVGQAVDQDPNRSDLQASALLIRPRADLAPTPTTCHASSPPTPRLQRYLQAPAHHPGLLSEPPAPPPPLPAISRLLGRFGGQPPRVPNP